MAKTIFVQGMRRSGTTIAFDLFWEDQRINCLYEPLALARREAVGGGSGAHGDDLMEKTREYRRRFMASAGLDLPIEAFNYGAPSDPHLEFEPNFSDLIEGYLRFAIDQAPVTLMKFVRAMDKVAALKALAPDACFIHVVRDPRMVAMSYMFGKNRRNEAKFSSPDVFFSRTTEKTAWSSYPLSELLLKKPEYARLSGRCTDLMRLLLLWSYNFQKTHADGQQIFGDRYLLLRHEDLVSDPAKTINQVYDFIGMDVSNGVLDWAEQNMKPRSRTESLLDNPGWREAVEAVGMPQAVRDAGYGEILDGS